jgi:hypothetical protein
MWSTFCGMVAPVESTDKGAEVLSLRAARL